MEQYILGLIGGYLESPEGPGFKVEPVYDPHGQVCNVMVSSLSGTRYVVSVEKVGEVTAGVDDD